MTGDVHLLTFNKTNLGCPGFLSTVWMWAVDLLVLVEKVDAKIALLVFHSPSEKFLTRTPCSHPFAHHALFVFLFYCSQLHKKHLATLVNADQESSLGQEGLSMLCWFFTTWIYSHETKKSREVISGDLSLSHMGMVHCANSVKCRVPSFHCSCSPIACPLDVCE